MKTPVASRTPITERCDSARRNDAPGGIGGDAARRTEAKTPRATASSTSTRSRDLDSARGARTKKKISAADREGSARADARTVIDGSRLVDKFTTLEEINNEGLTKAYDAFVAWNVDELRRLLPDELPYAKKKQVQFYWAKNCRGVLLLHYPPSSESGPDTNLSLDVHNKMTDEDDDGRVIFKLKSRCMLLNAYGMAHWMLSGSDKYDCREIRVSDDDGASHTVYVDNRSALVLDVDHLEMFPTFDDNKVNIRATLKKKYGSDEANAYIAEAGKRYAALARARQAQVFDATRVRPPLLQWNVGKTDETKPLGGAQMDAWTALQSAGDAGDVFTSHHPAFLIRGTPKAKLSATHADDNFKGFAEAMFGAHAGTTPSANASGPASASDAIVVAAPPPPSTTITIAARPPGFWERTLRVANLSEEEREDLREEFRRDVLEHLQAMRDKMADMRAAVKLVENLERAGVKPSVEEMEAYDSAQKDSVRKEREGGATGRATMIEARAAVDAGNASAAQKDSVRRQREGAAKGAATGRATMIEAHAAVDAGNASAAQKDWVRKEREGAAKGAATGGATMIEAHAAVDTGNASAAQKDSVRRQREGGSKRNDAWVAYKAGNATEEQRALVAAEKSFRALPADQKAKVKAERKRVCKKANRDRKRAIKLSTGEGASVELAAAAAAPRDASLAASARDARASASVAAVADDDAVPRELTADKRGAATAADDDAVPRELTADKRGDATAADDAPRDAPLAAAARDAPPPVAARDARASDSVAVPTKFDFIDPPVAPVMSMTRDEAKAALDLRRVPYRAKATLDVLQNMLNVEVEKEQRAREAKAKGTSIARFFVQSPT